MDFGLIGFPLQHSYSKIIHEEISSIPYQLVSLPPHDLSRFMREKDFKGINVTIPFKEKVIPFLDELSPQATKINAVNTIINKNGHLKGYNTDMDGFIRLLKFHQISIYQKKILILGSGGSAKTVKHALLKLHAKEIYIVSRNPGKDLISYATAQTKLETQVIINATPSGMYPNVDDPCLLNLSLFPNLESVVDLIYNPFRTNLLIQARDRGCKIASGLYMLVAQAIRSSELFLNRKYEEQYYRQIYFYLLRETTNLVLIGMPSVGKTTAGKNLATTLKKEWYDTDLEIEKDMKMKVCDIFKNYGEEYFRNLETKKIKELMKKKGIILSTGGGAILSSENRHALMRNGYLIFLNRDIKLLQKNSKAILARPLLDSLQSFAILYQERYPLYHQYCDLEFANNYTQWNTLNYLLRKLV